MGCGSSISSTGSGSGSGAGITTTSSDSGSGSACAFFVLVDRVVFAFFDFAVFLPPAAFLLPLFVAVDATDIFDFTEIPLVSIDSSRSGMSVILGASISDCMVMSDCVDSRVDVLVDALEVLADFEARPFFAFGLFEGAVVPAKTKNGQSGLRR